MSNIVPVIARWMICGLTPVEIKIQEEMTFLGEKFIAYNGKTVKNIIENHIKHFPEDKVTADIAEDKEYYLYMQRHTSGEFKTTIFRRDTDREEDSLFVSVEEPFGAVKDAFYTEVIIFET